MEEKRLAVLIDADNISHVYAKTILDEASNFGNVTYKRIYGDWSKQQLQSWRDVLLENGIRPIQQCNYTSGKNSTDSAMIIDAMDILYTGRVDGFCLVTSDSDFTGLAARLREAGMLVVGMGMQHTPSAMVSACNPFKYLDRISESETAEETVRPDARPAEKTAKDNGSDFKKLKKLLREVVTNESDEEGWMMLSKLGTQLQKRKSDFDVRNYGYKKMVPFLESLNLFEIKEVQNKHNPGKILYVRLK